MKKSEKVKFFGKNRKDEKILKILKKKTKKFKNIGKSKKMAVKLEEN